ncbi:MAG: 4Fe-4S dicluster domain-containing protein [Chloroflexi bacterium]|nr:4Fe-4S dicluster domain-containing protein [Chloroflexota bacterium]
MENNSVLTADKGIVTPKAVVINKRSFRNLIEALIKNIEVVGVKAKDGKYVYDRIASFDELCLDYDVTVIPPTKYLFPPIETILQFKTGNAVKAEPVLNNTPRAIIGVHPYDIRAIELLDEVFIATNPDPNYIARRQSSLIIGVDCLHPSPKSFAPCIGTNVAEKGFDFLLTDIGDSYMVTIGSQKGADLLAKYAQVSDPTSDDIVRQKVVRDEALTKCHLKLNCPKERIPKLLEDSYDDAYWEKRASTCLSCGSCVMVCPTCFCFDVQDDVSLNLKDGERTRLWDGCMLVDFAKVAAGENFRHDKTSRFRHRIYRKGKYVLERYGKMGCVGCGRCVTACLAEIASPIEVFNAIDESFRTKQAALRALRESRPENELYTPRPAEVVRVERLGTMEKVFEFKLKDGKPLGQRPVVGIRGPFGNGFPISTMAGKDLLLGAGGTGLFPLRSLVQYVLDKRSSFGRMILLFGARSPSERLFVDDLAAWKQNPDIEFLETVDKGDKDWSGNVGVITTLISKVQFDPKKTVAVVVGPPIMYRFIIAELKKRDLADENIIVSLERRMKCGVGKCGHCQINNVYVCQEGPVFTLANQR